MTIYVCLLNFTRQQKINEKFLRISSVFCGKRARTLAGGTAVTETKIDDDLQVESRGQTVYMAPERAKEEVREWIEGLEFELLRAKSAAHAMEKSTRVGERRHAIRHWKSSQLALAKVRSVSAGGCQAVEESQGGRPLVVSADHRRRNFVLMLITAFVGGLTATFAIGPYIMVGYENREAVRQELRTQLKAKRFEEVRDELANLRADLTLAEGDIRSRMVDIREVLEPYRVMTEAIQDDLQVSSKKIQKNNEPTPSG